MTTLERPERHLGRAMGQGDVLTRPAVPTVRVERDDRPDAYIAFPADHPAWVPGLVARVAELLAFPAGWDGGDARPASAEATLVTLHLMAELALPEVPSPSAFLLPDGGLQLEWHTGGWDVEIEVQASGDIHAWGGALDGSAEVVAGSLVDLGPVRDLLVRLGRQLGLGSSAR